MNWIILTFIILLILAFVAGYIVKGHVIHKKHIKHQLKIISECRDTISELQRNKEIGDELREFPKYYINLDRSKERRGKFEEGMQTYGVTNHQRVSAFDGKQINDTHRGTINGIQYYNRDKICTNAELAITMSHLLAIKQASDDGCQVSMIMEDDCELTLAPYWPIKIDRIVSGLPKDCEIFLMCNRRYQMVDKIQVEKVTNPIEFTGVCYLVTRRGMEKIKRFLVEDPEDETFSINLDLKNIVFDQGFMSQFNVYTYNISLFLLENYSSLSTHVQQGKEIPDINFESMEILKNKPFLLSE